MSEFSSLVTREKPRELGPAPGGKSGALLATYEGGVRAIVKVVKSRLPSGHHKQRGVPAALHPLREVAYYELDQMLGYGLVPETALTSKAVPGRQASAQLFIPALHLDDLQPSLADTDAEDWGDRLVEACVRVPKVFWKRLLVLDVIGGVRDRHANNVGVLMRVVDDHPAYRPVAWDNAVSFGKTFDRYHNVFHKYLFRRSVDLGDEWVKLDRLTRADLRFAVGELVNGDDIEHAFKRARFFCDYPYRLPWKVCSDGRDGSRDFPDYRAYFEPSREGPLHMSRVAI